jgi:predicted N-acyltransferase
MKPIRFYRNTTGTKSFRKYPNNIFGKHDIQEIQKTVILVAAHMLQKTVM